MRRFRGACAVVCIALAPGLGGTPVRAEQTCLAANAEEARVDRIVDGRTLALADGRLVVLALLDPAYDPAVETAGAAALAPLRGQMVRVTPTRTGADRYVRHHGVVALAGGGSIQDRLVAAGVARVAPKATEAPPEGCLKALIAKEDLARREKAGFWREAGQITPFALKSAESGGEMEAATGRFVVAEGVVRSVRKSGTTTYLNFARSYVRGFSAWVGGKRLAAVEADGFRLAALQGKRIRLRGWIEMRQGPRMEIALREQIELVDTPATTRGAR